jgi:SAM-dependent methyltransferase
MPTCPICGHAEGNLTHEVRELFLGTRDRFIYGECVSCGVLWLPEPPDLTDYYQQSDYLPLKTSDLRPAGATERVFRALLTDAALRGFPLARLKRSPSHWSELVRTAGAGRHSRILDVGAGSGSFLRQLQRNGFDELTGIDPFLVAESSESGLRLERATLDDFHPRRPFDVVFLNDVFEHVPDPRGTLRQLLRVLAPTGTVVIRIPMADSYAWRTYGTHWFGLDPPRHIVIQTRKSMNLLTREVGFAIASLIYDSYALQFYGSELYKRGIAFNDRTVPTVSEEDFRRWDKQAAYLNANEDGDHATFFLRRSDRDGV